MDWHSRTWKSLVELARDGTLQPLTTSITAREVEARLTEALVEADLGSVLDDYFAGKPPFGEGKRAVWN